MIDAVQVAVDDLAAALGRSVLVEDPRHQPLWWSVQDAVDATRMRSILQRTVDPAAVAVVARLGLARATGPVRTPAAPEAEMLPRWCVPLRSGSTHLGYLWVLDADASVTETDLPAVVACADLAAGALAASTAAADEHATRRAALLTRLSSGPDDAVVHELLTLEHLDRATRVVVHAPRRDRGWDLDDELSVHVVAATQPALAASGPPVPLGDLATAVHRARVTRRALAAGARLDQPTWEHLGAWLLVAEAPPALTPADVHPGADLLAGATRTDLLSTARTVLEHGGDVAASAAELHIHRTTLYYRLDRIAALTGVDLRSGPDRLDLHLALRLAAYRAAVG